MKLFGKSIKEYFSASWQFFAAAVLLMTYATVRQLNNTYDLRAQTTVTLLGVAVIVWAGVSAVKEHKFNLCQTALVGFLVSLGAAWTLPISHPPLEAFYIFIINGALYALVATISGLVAKKVYKL